MQEAEYLGAAVPRARSGDRQRQPYPFQHRRPMQARADRESARRWSCWAAQVDRLDADV